MNIIKEKTVAEVIAENVGSDRVFSKYKIDMCCGGGVTIEDACKERGVEFEIVNHEIEIIKNIIVGNSNLIDLNKIKFNGKSLNKNLNRFL